MKIANKRLGDNWADDEWPDVIHVSHVYTPGNWRSYIPEPVRCRDCAHYEPELYEHIACELFMQHVEPDDYCNRGERR